MMKSLRGCCLPSQLMGVCMCFVAECVCDHGKCEDGLAGSGRCVCYKGWKGASCSVGKTHTNTPSRAH